MENLFEKVNETVGWLESRLPKKPEIGVVLGTGLGGAGRSLTPIVEIPFTEIPNFPVSTAHGHDAKMVLGAIGHRTILAMQGRFHYYEGLSLDRVTLPIRVISGLSANTVIIVCAAGGLNTDFTPGSVMLVKDHINLMGDNPLRGATDERLGERYPDMSKAYDQELMDMARQAALDKNILLATGVYAAVQGPSLETPAETRMLRLLGADAVGMSLAAEVIVAKQVGLRVLAFAAITNVNIPDIMAPITVDAVISNARKADPKISALITAVVQGL